MKKVIITYNTSHYIILFRSNLIQAIQNLGYQVVAVAPIDKYSARFSDLNIEYEPISMDNKGINPFKDIKLVVSLYKKYRKIRPDIILHFTIKPNIYGTIASNLLGIPTINNVTGLGTAFLGSGFVKSISKHMYSYALRRANMVFFQNDTDHRLFLDWDIVSTENSAILPGSGIDTVKFSPSVGTKKEHKKFVFLLIARVIKDKGILEYVRAVEILKAQGEQVEAQLLGQLGVENRGALTRYQVDEWVKNGLINYLGERDDVRGDISAADCVVLPSYREGSSKTLLEAASMAKPIVATDVPGCNNIVLDGINGYLCNARDAVDLAAKMKKMMQTSSAQREVFGINGRDRVVKLFAESIVINKYIETINKLI